jgi:hypothetical protein
LNVKPIFRARSSCRFKIVRGQYGHGSPSTVTSQAKRAGSAARDRREARGIGHGGQVGSAYLPGLTRGEAGEPGPLGEHVLEVVRRNELGVGLPVHLHELREDELDPHRIDELAHVGDGPRS